MEWGNHYLRFGISAMVVQMIGVIIFILINTKSIKNGKPYEVGTLPTRQLKSPRCRFGPMCCL